MPRRRSSINPATCVSNTCNAPTPSSTLSSTLSLAKYIASAELTSPLSSDWPLLSPLFPSFGRAVSRSPSPSPPPPPPPTPMSDQTLPLPSYPDGLLRHSSPILPRPPPSSCSASRTPPPARLVASSSPPIPTRQNEQPHPFPPTRPCVLQLARAKYHPTPLRAPHPLMPSPLSYPSFPSPTSAPSHASRRKASNRQAKKNATAANDPVFDAPTLLKDPKSIKHALRQKDAGD